MYTLVMNLELSAVTSEVLSTKDENMYILLCYYVVDASRAPALASADYISVDHALWFGIGPVCDSRRSTRSGGCERMSRMGGPRHGRKLKSPIHEQHLVFVVFM